MIYLGLSVLGENSGSDAEELVDELEDGVSSDFRSLKSELLKSDETGILEKQKNKKKQNASVSITRAQFIENSERED